MIPYPGARALFIWGDPMWVDATASREELEVKRQELEQFLSKMTSEADSTVSEEST